MQREDTYFMRDLHATMLRRPRIAGNLLLFGIVGFFVWAVYWANGATLDEITSGQGQVIPSGQLQVAQNFEGGIISEIFVAEGEVVEKGQILMRLDDTQFASKARENRSQVNGLEAVIFRLQAEIDGSPLTFPEDLEKSVPHITRNEQALFESRAREFAATINVLKQQRIQRKQELIELDTRLVQLERSRELTFEELEITKPLVDKGVIPRVELIRLERAYNEIFGTLETSKQAIPRLKAALAEIDNTIAEQRANFTSRALKELNEAQIKVNALTETLTSSDDRVQRTEVRAPAAGIVKRVLVNTIGGTVGAGMDLVEIVPRHDNLLVEARIRPSDIGFLHPGLRATVKITAYDYTIFGSLPAELVYISADTILDEKQESYYLIRVQTDDNHLRKDEKILPIIPGMTAEVDVLTGKRTVLEYLMKPLMRGREKALRER